MAVRVQHASIIGERIYERAAPILDVTPSPDRNSFLHEVAAVLDSVRISGCCARVMAQHLSGCAAGKTTWRIEARPKAGLDKCLAYGKYSKHDRST